MPIVGFGNFRYRDTTQTIQIILISLITVVFKESCERLNILSIYKITMRHRKKRLAVNEVENCICITIIIFIPAVFKSLIGCGHTGPCCDYISLLLKHIYMSQINDWNEKCMPKKTTHSGLRWHIKRQDRSFVDEWHIITAHLLHMDFIKQVAIDKALDIWAFV